MTFKEEERPWGRFERFTLNEPSTVKLVYVHGDKRLSLQYHNNRSEVWKVIKGPVKVQIGNDTVITRKISMRPGGLSTAVAVTATLMIVPLLAVVGPAQAATCNSPVRYASTSDTIYVTVGTVDTLTEIKAACPGAPLALVDPANKIWELNADLVLQTGATLTLNGAGDVKVLRLQSLPSGLQKDVTALTAQYGQIDMTGVQVTSWNGTGPDTDTAVPS